MPYTPVSSEELAALEGLQDWREVLRTLQTRFRCGDFARAAVLVTRIVQAADEADHHPDVDLRYPDVVRVVLATHVTGGLTTADVELARRLSALAREVGARAEPDGGQVLEIAIDTMDADRIRPFWAAVLGYQVARDGSLVDRLRVGPPVWFQEMEQPRTQRDRFHLDVDVPHDVAPARLAAALEAGGTLVTDRFAPAWWVLADADGNEACICTWQGRSGN